MRIFESERDREKMSVNDLLDKNEMRATFEIEYETLIHIFVVVIVVVHPFENFC